MKTEIEKINSVQQRIKVSVPVEVVNGAFEKAFQKLRNRVELKGFRKGKAPIAMIKKMYGEHVSADVGENLINESLPDAMRNNLENNKELKPVGSPVLEEPKTPEMDQEFSFSVILDVFPEINLENHHKDIKVEIPSFKVQTSDVEKNIEHLRRQHATTKSVDVAANDHQVKFDQTATVDGEAFPQETGNDRMIILGKGHTFEGFEKKFVGCKAGDIITADVKLPEDYVPEEFQSLSLIHI